MPKPQAFCIFCGGSGLSKEHIMPEWIQKFVDGRTFGAANYIRRTIVEGSAHSYQEKIQESQKARPGNFLTRQARVVCRDCNEGWMSTLEEAVKPVVKCLVLGTPTTITPADQKFLASWICLKTIVNEYFQVPLSDRSKAIAVDDKDRKYLMDSLAPPDNWRILIGHNKGASWRSQYYQYRVPLRMAKVELEDGTEEIIPVAAGDTPTTQSTIFGLREMVFYAFSTSNPGVKLYSIRNEKTNGQYKIWPARTDSIAWPTTPAMDDISINSLAFNLYNELRRNGVSLPGLDTTLGPRRRPPV